MEEWRERGNIKWQRGAEILGQAGETERDRDQDRHTERVIKEKHRETGRDGGEEIKRHKETETKRNRGRESEAPLFQAVTKLALPEGGVSLESSQLCESQAALEIWGREGGSGGK